MDDLGGMTGARTGGTEVNGFRRDAKFLLMILVPTAAVVASHVRLEVRQDTFEERHQDENEARRLWEKRIETTLDKFGAEQVKQGNRLTAIETKLAD